MHRFEVIISRRADGKTGRAFVGDMTEAKSLELASKLASEGFIFMVRVCVGGGRRVWTGQDRLRRGRGAAVGHALAVGLVDVCS